MSFSPSVTFSLITCQEPYVTLWLIFTVGCLYDEDSISWKENYPNSSENTTTMEMSKSVTFLSFSGLFQFQRFFWSEYICCTRIFHFSKYEVIKCNIFFKKEGINCFWRFLKCQHCVQHFCACPYATSSCDDN